MKNQLFSLGETAMGDGSKKNNLKNGGRGGGEAQGAADPKKYW
jgi:hypothetical protein